MTTKAVARVTINLIRPAADALDEIVERNGNGQTDAINRALQAYAPLDRALAEGKRVMLQDLDGKLEFLNVR